MKSRVTLALLVAAGLMGCDKMEKMPVIGPAATAVGGFFKKKPPAPRPGTPRAVPADSTAQVAAADSAAHAAAPAPAPVPAATPKKVQHVAAAVADEPWTPTDTGTVNPGMTHDQVVAVWGVPVTERKKGEWTYLYFRNGCEYSCGTFDVVFLDNDQVVDAVVRGPGHTYSGNSSSPAGRVPEKTPTTLTVPAQQTTPPQEQPPVAPAPAPAPSGMAA